MKEQKGFEIEVCCRDAAWWQYNVAFTAACYDQEGLRIGFASSESHMADVGSNAEPLSVKNREVKLETMPCDHLELYLYIIPHSLPEERLIERTKPFDLTLKTSYNGKLVRKELIKVNRWGGLSQQMIITH